MADRDGEVYVRWEDRPMYRSLFPKGYRWTLARRMLRVRTWLARVTDAYGPARGIEYRTSETQGGRLPTLDEYERHCQRSPHYASVWLRQQAQRLNEAFGMSEEVIELVTAADLLERYYDPTRHTAERFGYRPARALPPDSPPQGTQEEPSDGRSDD